MSRWSCKDYLRGTCNKLILWKMASSRMLVLQDQEWLPFWGEVPIRTSSGWTHSRRNGPNRIMTKALWLYWKRKIGKRESLSQMLVTIERGNLWEKVVRNWDKIHPEVSFLMHDNWVAYFRTWRRRRLFSGRALTCRSQSSVWNSKKAIARHTKIRDQNPSLGYICPGAPHERSPNAPKFEDRSQEETEWQEQGAPRSNVEAGQKCVQIKGAWKSSILLVPGK